MKLLGSGSPIKYELDIHALDLADTILGQLLAFSRPKYSYGDFALLRECDHQASVSNRTRTKPNLHVSVDLLEISNGVLLANTVSFKIRLSSHKV